SVLELPGVGDELASPGPGRVPAAAVRGEVLVRFRPAANRAQQQRVASNLGAKARFFQHPNQPAFVQKQIASGQGSVFDQLAVLTLPDRTGLSQAISRLRKHPDVLYAEPNYRLRITGATTGPVIPNDFDFA